MNVFTVSIKICQNKKRLFNNNKYKLIKYIIKLLESFKIRIQKSFPDLIWVNENEFKNMYT